MNTTKQDLKRFMIYIEPDLLEKIRMISGKYSRSVNGQIIWTLKQLAAEEEKLFQKTNKHWYPYKDMGSWYRLENGMLFQAYMERDGSIAKVYGEVNAGEVDPGILEGEYLDEDRKILITDRLNEIYEELLEKE